MGAHHHSTYRSQDGHDVRPRCGFPEQAGPWEQEGMHQGVRALCGAAKDTGQKEVERTGLRKHVTQLSKHRLPGAFQETVQRRGKFSSSAQAHILLHTQKKAHATSAYALTPRRAHLQELAPRHHALCPVAAAAVATITAAAPTVLANSPRTKRQRRRQHTPLCLCSVRLQVRGVGVLSRRHRRVNRHAVVG